MTPTVEGTYRGKCYELCGVYHSRMLFNVKVVSEADYEAHLLDPAGPGQRLRPAAARRRSTSQTARPSDSREVRNDRHHAVDRRRRGASAPRRSVSRSSRSLTTTDHKVIGKLYLDDVVRLVPHRRRDGADHALRARLPRACSSSTTRSTTSCSRCTARSCCCCSRRRCSSASATCIMPLQIGSPDVAFPRLNMFSYWLFLFGGLIAASGFLTPGGAADFGWFAYTPLSDAVRSPERRRRPVDHGPVDGRSRHHPRRGQLHHHDHLHARTRHDDVPDADLHLEHAGHAACSC